MSNRVRKIMAISAIVLMAILLILMGLQSKLHTDTPEATSYNLLPALGPMEARPLAEALTIVDPLGSSTTMADLKGNVLYLNFWASWCTPCLTEMPLIEKMQLELGDLGFKAVMINMDQNTDLVTKAKDLQKSLAPSVWIKYEDTRRLQEQYNIHHLPYHILIDRRGHTATAFYSPLDRNLAEFKAAVRQLLDEK